MYNLKAIQDKLFGLVGFHQVTGTSIPALPDALLESRSGIYFNDLHSLFTYHNLLASINRNEYGENPLGEFLTKTVKAAINEMLAYCIRERKLVKAGRALYEDLLLFNSVGNRNFLIPRDGRFCGVVIDQKQVADISTKIIAIGVQMLGQNQPFNLYVYHTSKPEPIQVIPVETIYPSNFKWVPTNIVLNYLEENLAPNGQYIIGYYERDLVGNAVEVQRDLSAAPCSTCNSYDIDAYDQYSKYIKVHTFSVPEEGLLPNDTDLWLTADMDYNYKTNFGLNLRVSSYCDITQHIVENENIFADALYHVVGKKLMNQIAYNIETKGDSAKVRDLAMYALNNGENHTPGLQSQAEKALKALNIDLTKVNNICLPCMDTTDIEDGTI